MDCVIDPLRVRPAGHFDCSLAMSTNEMPRPALHFLSTRAPRQTFWVARVWRLVWTARALDRLLMRFSAPNIDDIVIGSAHQRYVAEFSSSDNALQLN